MSEEEYFDEQVDFCKCGHEKFSHYMNKLEGQRFCANINCNCKDFKLKKNGKQEEKTA